MTCAHAGWGQYAAEEGACPPPAEMVSVPGGHQCPTCGFSVRVAAGPDAEETARGWAAARERAVIARETR